MMEFEENAPITDEQRILAEGKRLTLEPLDPSVAPEEHSDEYTAAEHLRGPAVANAPNDVEQNAPAVQPTPSLVSPTASQKAPAIRTVRAGAIAAIIFLAVIILAIIVYMFS